MVKFFETYLSLKERLDTDGGVVVQYKEFVAVAEFFTGPNGEGFDYSVYGLLDDAEEYDFFHCRVEAMVENEGHYETEGEALAAAFHAIDHQFLPQKEVL